MTRAPESGNLKRAHAGLPPSIAEIMWPELPSLADEIVAGIRRAIPEYARPLGGPYGRVMRLGVERAIAAFVQGVANPTAPRDRRDEICRKLGRFEALEGRSLDDLQAAYRIGARIAWRRVMKVGQRQGLSSPVMSQLAESLFVYMDELATLSVQGYLEARAHSDEELASRRRRLLQLILERPRELSQGIAGLAERSQWTVPARATMVAVRDRVDPVPQAMHDDVLADLTCAKPYLLIPGPLDAGRRAMLNAAMARNRAAGGFTMPLIHAADSLRWARRTLALSESGIIDDGAVIASEEHILTLLLTTEPTLIDQLASRHLAELASFTSRKRQRLIDTLREWLTTKGTALQVGNRLNVHPQTVRYRIRQLERVFGDKLANPEERFAIELALRALWLQKAPAGAAPDQE